MASIVPIVIGCIDYLAYGTLFTHAMFRPKIKLDFFFPPEKPQMTAGRWCVANVNFYSLSLFFLSGVK